MTVNGVDDTFVGQAEAVSVDQMISMLANIYLLRHGNLDFLNYGSTIFNDLACGCREMNRLAAMKRRHHKESNVFTSGSYDTSSSQRIKRS